MNIPLPYVGLNEIDFFQARFRLELKSLFHCPEHLVKNLNP